MRKKRRSAYLLESLEARLLFSADLAPLPVDSGTTGAEFESDLEISLQPDSAGVQEAGENTQERQEVIFVDSGVDDYQQFIDDIESQLEKGRQFDIVNLDSDSDGIDQISAYLRQHEGIDAVHVVSHGSEDAVKLGNVWLTPDKLDAYADAIEGWQQALSGDADLLFYGCNLAAGDGGQDLVNSLTLLTDADVAASDDVTGSAQFGGDWVLEYKSGEIEASVPFTVDLQANWSGLLNTFTVTTTADGVAGSLRQAIIDANALGGTNEITLNPGTYTLSLGELEITSDLTINGADARTTLIDGNGADRVFKIDGNSTATLTGITIMNGNQNNSGGLFVNGGSTLNLSDAIVRDNTSNMGGGIHVHGTANLERVLLYNNTANEGGGIHFHGADGGSLINVTISGNNATSEGGGLWTDSSINMINVTIADNNATTQGGGMFVAGGTVDIANSIVADNSAGGTGPDVFGTLSSSGSNLFESLAGGSGFHGSDVTAVDPLLGLSDNGGSLMTHAPAAAQAIDGADRALMPTTDQRGFLRGDSTPDMGAHEVGASVVSTADYFDQFNAVAYNGDDGALPWANDWQEFGDGTGAGGGSIQVTSHFGDLALQIESPGDGAWRQADLAGATSATLSFNYARSGMDAGDTIIVEISTDGTNWDELTRFDGPADDSFWHTFSTDISAYIDSDTRIRFTAANGMNQGDDHFFVDNVRINLAGTSPTNNPPTATNLTSTSSYNEGDASVDITDIVVTDVDSGEMITATLTLNDTTTGSLSANNGATYDGGTGVWTITDTVANVNLALANLVFNPNTDNDVDTTITTHIEDAAGAGPVDGTITLDVTPANDAPTATNLTSTSSYNEGDASVDFTDIVVTDVDSGEMITATLTLNDTTTGSLSANNGATYDGGTGVWTITNTVANVNLALANLVFNPNTDNDVDTTITTHIVDATGAGPADGTITLDVTPANDVPVATGNTVIGSEDVPLVIGPGDFNFTDTEGDSLVSVTITGLNLNGGTLTHSAGAVTVTNGMTITAAELADLTFTSALNDSTDCSFTYTVNDAGSGVTSAVMNISVNAVNDVPVATGNTVIGSEDVPLVIGPGDFNFTDVEGDSLVSVTITGLNLNGGTLTHSAGAVTVTNGMTITAAELADLTFTSALNDSTDCSFTYTVNDAGSGVTSAVMNITVNAVNDVPVATGNTVIGSEDVPLVIGPGDFNFTDTEGDSLVSVTITGLNLNGGTLTHSAGAVTVTNGMTITAAELADLTFTSALNDSTDCSFSYTVNDAGSGVTSAVMNITVNAVNDAGTVTIDNTTPAQGDTLTANVIDPDGASGAISFQWFSGGVVIGGATGKTYTTTQADVGAIMTVTAIYTDDQGTAESLTSAPTAPVTNVNDTPIAVNDNLNATEDQSLAFTAVTDLLGNDTDVDGDTLTLSEFTQPANGMLVNNADGTMTYMPADDFYGIDSFTYTISDGNGETADGAAIIVVTPVGDTPQVTNVSTDAGVQSGLINIDRNANDGAEVTHFKISGITNGTLYLADGVSRIDNGDFITVGQGQAGLRFTPAANSTADGSFNVESSEDGVSVASQSDIATSIISILTTAPQPSVPVPSPPPSGPEAVVSEEAELEENEELEDVAEETDVQAVAEDMAPVETPPNAKAPGIKKASVVPGISVFRRADLNSNKDRIPGRSTFLSPQTIKKLVESENLGELKTVLGKLDITTLPPDVYELVRGSLDAVQEEMGNEILIGKTVVGSAIATSVGLSAGYVVWMLKGGSLMASVLSSLPAWQLADPLAILVGTKDDEDEDDDTLETIIKDGSRRNEDKKSKTSELDKHKKESTKR